MWALPKKQLPPPPPALKRAPLGTFFHARFYLFTIFTIFLTIFLPFSLNKCPKPSGQGFRPPQNQANAHLNLENSSLKKCPKPSGQALRPPPPCGQCPNRSFINLSWASQSNVLHCFTKDDHDHDDFWLKQIFNLPTPRTTTTMTMMAMTRRRRRRMTTRRRSRTRTTTMTTTFCFVFLGDFYAWVTRPEHSFHQNIDKGQLYSWFL